MGWYGSLDFQVVAIIIGTQHHELIACGLICVAGQPREETYWSNVCEKGIAHLLERLAWFSVMPRHDLDVSAV
jgi:hypothetical protein